MDITAELLENGYIVHNDKQISVEFNREIRLYTVDNIQEFIATFNLVTSTEISEE